MPSTSPIQLQNFPLEFPALLRDRGALAESFTGQTDGTADGLIKERLDRIMRGVVSYGDEAARTYGVTAYKKGHEAAAALHQTLTSLTPHQLAKLTVKLGEAKGLEILQGLAPEKADKYKSTWLNQPVDRRITDLTEALDNAYKNMEPEARRGEVLKHLTIAFDRDETFTSFKHVALSHFAGRVLPESLGRIPWLAQALAKVNIIPGKVVELEAAAPGMHEWLLGFGNFFRQNNLPVPLQVRTQGTIKRIEEGWNGPFRSEALAFVDATDRKSIGEKVYATEDMAEATKNLVTKARNKLRLFAEEILALEWIRKGSPGHDKKCKQNGAVLNHGDSTPRLPAAALVDNSGSERDHVRAGGMDVVKTKDPRGWSSNFGFTERGSEEALRKSYSDPVGLTEAFKRLLGEWKTDHSSRSFLEGGMVQAVDSHRAPVPEGYKVEIIRHERDANVWRGYGEATKDMVKIASGYRLEQHPIRARATTDYPSIFESSLEGSGKMGSLAMVSYLGVKSAVSTYRRTGHLDGFLSEWGGATLSMGGYVALEQGLMWWAKFKGFRYPALISMGLGGLMSLYTHRSEIDDAGDAALLFGKGALVDGLVSGIGSSVGSKLAGGALRLAGASSTSALTAFAKSFVGTAGAVEVNEALGGELVKWAVA